MLNSQCQAEKHRAVRAYAFLQCGFQVMDHLVQLFK
jgi:hypothetical protein